MFKIEGAVEDTHKISKILSEKFKECNLDESNNYQLISLNDDVLLVWCKEEACLYSQILQRIIDTETQLSGSQPTFKVQRLALTKPPIWDVSRILSNSSGTGVLLIGKKGIAVVQLPKRWGNPPLFEGGTDALTCRVEYIGEQFFTCNTNVNIISADWHPGSLDHKSIVILSSDNYLRIYSLPYLEIPEQAIRVAKSPMLSTECGRLGIEEYAVAFGIGPPLCSDENVFDKKENMSSTMKAIMDVTDRRRQMFQALQWPVFILYNSGNIYYTVTSLNRKRIRRKVLYGPISMVPSSFDNYGLDFCSLLVLPSSPAVLVIANSKGYLHHCIVMESASAKLRDIEELSEATRQLNLETSSIQLHVYESVHLNLSVTEQLSQHKPVLLLPDPNTQARYWVLHNDGIHGVSLPLVERLLSEGDDFPDWDLECHVEHFVCTRPIESVDSCSVIGLAASISPCKIFVLLNSGSIHVIPLPSAFIPNVPYFTLGSDSANAAQRNIKSKKEPFEEYIRSILQRSTSQPLLLSGSNPEVEPEEYLTLLSRVTDMLRKNYIQPQIRAREQIQRRQTLLLEQKELLQNELTGLEAEKSTLTKKAHELAEKYEEANDRHKIIMKRLEVVIGHLVRQMPVLSSNERAMLKELEDMMEKSKAFASELTQIKEKNQWQQSQIEKQTINEALKLKSTSLGDNQLKCLKTFLSQESAELVALVNKIKQIKKELGI